MSDFIEPISLLTATTAYNPDSEHFSDKRKLKFAELDAGREEEALINEGYKDTHKEGRQKQISEMRDGIADHPERQRFWTEMMRNHELSPGNRLKASELLAKSEGDFDEGGGR